MSSVRMVFLGCLALEDLILAILVPDITTKLVFFVACVCCLTPFIGEFFAGMRK